MNELTIEGKTYLSSKRAAEITGYAKDYVGQLAREGYVVATMVGRSWYVLESSIRAHRFGNDSGESVSTSKTVTTQGAERQDQSNSVHEEEDTHKWVPAVYVPEEIQIIAPIKKDVVSFTAPNYSGMPKPTSTVAWPSHAAIHESESNLIPASKVEENSLPNMQEAWQEWFAHKNQKLLETEEVIESRSEPVREAFTEEPQPTAQEVNSINMLTLEPVESQKPLEREYSVPIRISPVVTHAPIPRPILPVENGTPRPTQAVVNRHQKKSNISIINALLIALIITTCTVVFIASGFGDKYINASMYKKSGVINFLEGKNYILR